ncbi:pyoverdine signaling pathway anti-sigma factor FpvR [Maricurvus nonylphenolicus]|uniref:FecR family protein n=1 Tax=Maricurvus nonylphenolicus TaxID=1008307 RepID=UPI0036F1DF4A
MHSDSSSSDNVAPFPNRAEIKQEACAWLVRLDQRDLSEQETQEFQAWVTRSDFHRDYLLKAAANWDSMAILEELAEMFPISDNKSELKGFYASICSVLTAFGERVRMTMFASGAVAVSVLLALVLLNSTALEGLLYSKPVQRNFVTAVGERANFVLEDGTSVTLNTNSRVNVEYTRSRRVVKLLRGEINVDVAKEPQRPFLVYAGKGMVWAVGTAFNVRSEAERVEVTVTEGTVKVYADVSSKDSEPRLSVDAEVQFNNLHESNVREAILDAGYVAQYSNVIESHTFVEPEDLNRKLAWREGNLIFKGETLEEALKEFSRYTDQKFVIVDASISQIRIGGYFKTDDIDALLGGLHDNFNIKSEAAGSNLIHLSAR